MLKKGGKEAVAANGIAPSGDAVTWTVTGNNGKPVDSGTAVASDKGDFLLLSVFKKQSGAPSVTACDAAIQQCQTKTASGVAVPFTLAQYRMWVSEQLGGRADLTPDVR